MGGSSKRKIFCPANKWTNVLWIAGVLFYRKYTVRVGDVRVRYRRYGVTLTPPYWEGDIVGSTTFALYPWEGYIRVDVKPPRDITVEVS
jgi:hypothetical protein